MNRTVELVNEWAKFEETHPKGNVGDFCRHYLIKKREKENVSEFLNGIVPSENASLLSKLLVKIGRIHNVYMNIASKELSIRQSEEFYFLSVIKNLKSPRKTEIIYHTVNELSNGLNILSSLVRQGYILEQPDTEDKRSKRVCLTPEGEKVLQSCYEKVHQVSELLFYEMPEDDISLCIQLLKNVEIKFTGSWLHHKSKTFNDVYKEITGKHSLKNI